MRPKIQYCPQCRGELERVDPDCAELCRTLSLRCLQMHLEYIGRERGYVRGSGGSE